jgi:GNAT superfamily N-acetyltransferase
VERGIPARRDDGADDDSRRQHSPGVVIARAQTNPASLHGRIAALAKAYEVEVWDVGSAMVEAGRDLGDRSVVDLVPAKIAVVCEAPTSSTAYGAIWFLMEQQYGVPFTAIKAADLPGVELAKYNVIVLPDGQSAGYARAFPQETVDRLKAWVRDGGTLVAIKGAAVWASGERVGLTTARDKYAAPPADEKSPKREDAPKRIDTVPGAFVQLDVDAEHYLGLGVDGPIAALFRSNVVFNPTRRGARVASLHKDRPIVAGFVFDEAREPLKAAPYLWDEPTGRGHVTLFADDPAFRTFLHGAHRLLLNAMLLGPSV